MADPRKDQSQFPATEREDDQEIPTTDPLARNPGGVARGRVDPLPGIPDDGVESTYTAGNNTGGLKGGGASTADVAGGGAGGDIDNPDVTGRGSLDDIVRGADVKSCSVPAGKKSSHS